MLLNLKTLNAGYEFSQKWPKNEPYLVMFEQTKSVKLALFSLTLMPSLALITAFLQLQFFGTSYINLTLAMTILFLTIPLHAFHLLGRMANSPLPASLQGWYRELESKMAQQELGNGVSRATKPERSQKQNSKLTYMDLAAILDELFERRQ